MLLEAQIRGYMWRCSLLEGSMKKEDSYQHRCQLFTMAKGQTCFMFLSSMKKEDLYQHRCQLFTLGQRAKHARCSNQPCLKRGVNRCNELNVAPKAIFYILSAKWVKCYYYHHHSWVERMVLKLKNWWVGKVLECLKIQKKTCVSRIALLILKTIISKVLMMAS